MEQTDTPSPSAEAADEEELLRRMEQEYRQDFSLPLNLDLIGLGVLVANLQIALRHPGNIGASSWMCQSLVDDIIQRVRREGFPACAEAMARGGREKEQVC